MLEKDIEKYLVNRIKTLGGLCDKFSAIARRGVPDRIVTLPNNNIIFVELKSSNGKLTKLQEIDHKKRKALGCKVVTINSKKMVDSIFPLNNFSFDCIN